MGKTRYKIADVIFELNTLYDFTKNLCKDYLYIGDKNTHLTITVTKEDIVAERTEEESTEEYLECIAVYRKLCEYVFKEGNGFVFHSSAVSVGGECYLFTAPSGTGKSTHVRLWKKLLGERAIVINDDKPLIRFIDGAFYAYGTPWSGKHKLDVDMRSKVKAICEIKRGKENKIEELSLKSILPTLLNQTVRPKEIDKMDLLLERITKMVKSVKTYRLYCNTSIDSAKLSYSVMSEGNNEN